MCCSDDSLSPHLTVAESMEVAASLKIGSDKSAEEKKEVVREILETLGLSEAAHTRSGHYRNLMLFAFLEQTIHELP